MHRWDIINALIKKNNYKSYLEIGYFKGWSFDNVRCEEKTAVDPNPSKTEEQEKWAYSTISMLSEQEGILKMTSDDFFSIKGITDSHFSKREGDTWDIIFIDGLHEASQVQRDIRNSLKYLSPNGTIVIHDCNPPTLAHVTTGDAGGNWNGDVYKAWITFRFQYPEYETYTVDTDWGCGIIHTPYTHLSWIDMTTEDISSRFEPWEKFDRDRNFLLNLISVEEFKTKLNERITDNNVSA